MMKRHTAAEHSGAIAGVSSQVTSQAKTVRIALCGNPNSGKSTIFNHLTGLRQRVANYPGVTVEARAGRFRIDNSDAEFEVIDVPGSYSLAAISPDEFIAVETIIGRTSTGKTAPPDLVIVVLDASNLERSLYLLAQVAEAGLPTIAILNQIDLAERNRLRLRSVKLAEILGIPVVSMVANKGRGFSRLKDVVREYTQIPRAKSLVSLGANVESFLTEMSQNQGGLSRPELIRAIFDKHGPAEELFKVKCTPEQLGRLEKLRAELIETHRGLPFGEAYTIARQMADITNEVTVRRSEPSHQRTEGIDSLVLHRIWGPLILLVIMIVMFQSIFTWAEPVMNIIDSGTAIVAASVASVMPDGAFKSLVVDGIIGGVGSVIIFLPQIIILFLFLGFLEDSGYLPRAAFIVDRLFRWCGLSGKSFVPLLSSFACAIPGIMATRVIEHPRQRLLTILVAPLMSCSARLPVYTVMIAAFIPFKSYAGGMFNSQGMTLVALYALGVVVAAIVAFIMKSTVLKTKSESFVMELPPFKAPTLKGIWIRTSLASKAFLKRAGTVIFAITVIIWALSYYPRPNDIEQSYAVKISTLDESQTDYATQVTDLENQMAGEYLRQSYFGRLGHALEPLFMPLGWDWKVTLAALASFPAREVVIATLGTIYNLGSEEDETSTTLVEKLRQSTWDSGEKTGMAVFTPAVALSIMVFFALCCQCGATLAIIKRETHSWGWPVFVFTYMTALAYVGAWGTYELFSSLGL